MSNNHVQNIKCTCRMCAILWLGTSKEAYMWVLIYPYLFHTDCLSTPNRRYTCQELCRSLHLGMDQYKLLEVKTIKDHQCLLLYHTSKIKPNSTHPDTVAHSHSTFHQLGRFYCLIPAVCSLHHRCRSLQSCRLYWGDCVDHLWEYQDHHSQWLGRTNSKYQ